MLARKGQYISLAEGSGSRSQWDEFELNPQNRVVQLGGERWGWVWNRPCGLVIRKGDIEHRVRIINYTRLIAFFLYVLSSLLVILGVFKVLRRNRGE
jgi:hypothetical protein